MNLKIVKVSKMFRENHKTVKVLIKVKTVSEAEK